MFVAGMFLLNVYPHKYGGKDTTCSKTQDDNSIISEYDRIELLNKLYWSTK